MERWNYPKNLKEILRIPANLDSFVNDYKIHVFEIAWLAEEMAEKKAEKQTKEMVIKLVKGGVKLEQVAEAMGVNVQQVKDWLATV